MVRCTVYYSGDVQGVGFRYTACRVAGGFDVTGYVRNLPDGRVECVAEGEPAEVEAFCEAVARRMGGGIRDEVRANAPATGAFSTFGVRT